MNNKKTNNLLTKEIIMSLTTLQTNVDNARIDATNMTDCQLVSSFAVHGCNDFSYFINFDRLSLIDLYVADRCYGMFHSVYAKMLNTL